jgi:hypothetical protein
MTIMFTRWISIPNLARIGQEIRKVRIERVGHAVAHLVEALRYKPAGYGLDSR